MIWVIATFTLALIPQLLRMPPAVAVMALLPLGWRVGSEFRGWKPLPPLVRHGMTVLALAALFFSYDDMAGRRAAVSLLAVMLSLKLVECYRIRDARLVVSFSLFLCATQFLFSQRIGMPVYAAVTVAAALATLARLHREEAWRNRGVAPAIRAPLKAELAFSLKLLALAVPVGLAFFILFPRLATPLWGIPEDTLDSKTGLSDSMSPGSIQQMFMDDSPAFRVTFTGDIPGQSELYWRGPVFWSFDGRTWKSSFYSRSLLADRRPGGAGAPWVYTVQLEPNERKWLFSLDYPASTPPDTRLTVDYQIIRRDPVTQLLEYSMTSNPDFDDMPELPQTLRLQALELPVDYNPRTRALVERWRRETPDDTAFVQRVLRHFNQEPFRYSLDSPLLGRDSVDDFLFESRTGFCEHYASTFAVMMRMAGIPARIVTGYQGGWYNAVGDYLLVRQSDAHAWTEVWFPQQGWTRVDPTAAVSPARVERGSLGALPSPRHILDFSWLRGLRNGIDIVQQRWNDWVIDYGAGRQARLLSSLGIGSLSPAMLVSILLVVIAVTGFLLYPVIMRVRGPAASDPVQRQWRRFLARLARAGFSAPPSHGPTELAEAASARLPEQAPAIRHVAGLYARCRYAATPPPLADLREAVRAFRPKKKHA